MFASEDGLKAARPSRDRRRLGRWLTSQLTSLLERLGWSAGAGWVRARAARGVAGASLVFEP